MKTTLRTQLAVTTLVFMGALGIGTLQAATIGYWRFDSGVGFLSDSGPNSFSLTESTTGPVSTAIPATGATSDFYDPIPQTSATNTNAANFGGNGFVQRNDAPAFTVTNFTIEALVNRAATTTGTQYIASQWNGSGSQRSWALGSAGSNAIGAPSVAANNLFFTVSSDGINTSARFDSGFTFTTGDDYYVAAAFDLDNDEITFYFQDLTNSGSLQSNTISSTLPTPFDSTAPFQIATLDAGSRWSGSIDEVRLSSVALSSTQLLAVPEPSTVAFLTIGFTLVVLRRARRAPMSSI